MTDNQLKAFLRGILYSHVSAKQEFIRDARCAKIDNDNLNVLLAPFIRYEKHLTGLIDDVSGISQK
jgi:hypothetical protein